MSSSRYAHVERERRFLVTEVPRVEAWAGRTITDLYVHGTRLRLRHSEGLVAGRPEVVRKLTQKVPDPDGVDGRRGTLTTIYLDEAEYARLAQLPGRWITKRRLSVPPLGVDLFEGPLAGLVVAEAEFDDDGAMASFAAPPWCGPEITDHAGFSGANLARLAALEPADAADELALLLRSVGAGDPH